MNLKNYIDLYELLQVDKSGREERRAFALSDPKFPKAPIQMLRSWLDAQHHMITGDKAAHIGSYLYWITLALMVIAFLFGLLSGIALLHYNGSEPVNVVYFMAMVILMPLLTMVLALLSMLRANRRQSTLIHLSPAYWMERLLAFFSKKTHKEIGEIKINPLLANWIIIRRSQWIALSFSLGLFVALIGMVVTKDIAFAWSTTLDVTPEAFHRLLSWVALPWREWMPSAVPSAELIEQSHYFRLGEKLSESMLSHASMLGGWWKFLAMATLFYAIVLRIVMILIAEFGYRRALKRSILSLEGAETLLRDMSQPHITTHVHTGKAAVHPQSSGKIQVLASLKPHYNTIIGWAIDEANLKVIAESLGTDSPLLAEAGGSKTLDEDKKLIDSIGRGGDILLIVKAWEPPTMDFIDFLDTLVSKADTVTVKPVGTPKEGYHANRANSDVWSEKLSGKEWKNVWIKH